MLFLISQLLIKKNDIIYMFLHTSQRCSGISQINPYCILIVLNYT